MAKAMKLHGFGRLCKRDARICTGYTDCSKDRFFAVSDFSPFSLRCLFGKDGQGRFK